MTIRGLHSCKKENTPHVGDVKNFIIEERQGKSGKSYTKIRSAPANMGGTPFEIHTVTATDYSDAHGNLSFNIEIEPVTLSESRSQGAVPVQTAPQTRSEGSTARPNGGGYEDRGNRIERQHSQEMAIRYATLKGLSEITPKDMVALIDWFQRDVSRVPAPPKAKAKANATTDQPPEPDEVIHDNGDEDEF